MSVYGWKHTTSKAKRQRLWRHNLPAWVGRSQGAHFGMYVRVGNRLWGAFWLPAWRTCFRCGWQHREGWWHICWWKEPLS